MPKNCGVWRDISKNLLFVAEFSNILRTVAWYWLLQKAKHGKMSTETIFPFILDLIKH